MKLWHAIQRGKLGISALGSKEKRGPESLLCVCMYGGGVIARSVLVVGPLAVIGFLLSVRAPGLFLHYFTEPSSCVHLPALSPILAEPVGGAHRMRLAEQAHA